MFNTLSFKSLCDVDGSPSPMVGIVPIVPDASTQVDRHHAMVVHSPMVRGLPTPMLELNPCQGLTTTLPVGTPIITPPSVRVQVSKPRKPVAGGKAISKPRQRSQGECEVVASLGRGVNGVVASHVVEKECLCN
jgi:hypothetical protein